MLSWWRNLKSALRGHPPQSDPLRLPASWRDYDIPEQRLVLAEALAECEDYGVEHDGDDICINLYDDARVLVGDAAIETLPDAIAALPGVREVTGDDREVLVVRGAISAEEVDAFVVAHLARTSDFDSSAIA